jgi:hypothetical protein
MNKPPPGFNDLLPREGKSDSERMLEFIERLGDDPIAVMIDDARAGSHGAFENLVDFFGSELHSRKLPDSRLLEYILEVLESRAVEKALFPQSGAGNPGDEKKLKRDLDLAYGVAYLIDVQGMGKDAARKQVADQRGVSVSTVRDAYKLYGDDVRRINRNRLKTDK